MKIVPNLNNIFLKPISRLNQNGLKAADKLNFGAKSGYRKLDSDTFTKNDTSTNYDFNDDDLENKDGAIKFGFDTPDLSALREIMRISILDGTLVGDKLKEEKTKSSIKEESQQQGKYGILQKPFSSRTGQEIYPFENFQEAPDCNGVRGKTPLKNKENAQKGMSLKFDLLKACNIDTIIDLRNREVCNKRTIDFVQNNCLNYYNFPVEEISNEAINRASIDKMSEFFDVINKGNFYIGCANGESRTDLAVGLNYVCNPNAQNVPRLRWLHTGNSDMSLNKNVKKLNKYIQQNPDVVKQWGWKNYDEYKAESEKRLEKAYEYNKIA